jgi:hypothetical protein
MLKVHCVFLQNILSLNHFGYLHVATVLVQYLSYWLCMPRCSVLFLSMEVGKVFAVWARNLHFTVGVIGGLIVGSLVALHALGSVTKQSATASSSSAAVANRRPRSSRRAVPTICKARARSSSPKSGPWVPAPGKATRGSRITWQVLEGDDGNVRLHRSKKQGSRSRHGSKVGYDFSAPSPPVFPSVSGCCPAAA